MTLTRLFLITAVVLQSISLAAGQEGTQQWGGKCISAQLPPPYSNYQEYCKALRLEQESYFVNLFKSAIKPNASSEFPLKGCSFGCVVGNSLRADFGSLPDLGGSWNGKCFRDFNGGTIPSDVINIILSPDGQYTGEAFPGELSVEEDSWTRLYRSSRGGVWALDYDGSEPEFGRDFRGYRDEMRELKDSPGTVLGKVFLKPYSRPFNRFNPLPAESFHFMLFQVCDEDNEYPNHAFDRILSP